MDAAAHRSKQGHRRAAQAAGALAVVAALLVAVGVVPMPDLDGPLEDASRTLGAWAYPAVAGLAFLETGAFVGLLVPGETGVVVGGVVAERGGVELVPLIGLVWLAAAAGDLVSFLLGRRLGRPFLERHGPRMHLGPDRLASVDRFYARHGGKAVLLGRFTGVIRAVSPFIAGASGLALRRFVAWSAAGALLWAATFTLVGYGFSESFAESGDAAARIGVVAALMAALAFVAAARLRSGGRGGREWTRQPQNGERTERTHAGPDERSGEHVEREVHTQVDAGEGDRRGDHQRIGAHPWAEDGYGSGGSEGRRAVAGREGRIPGDRSEGTKVGIGNGRTLPVEDLLEEVSYERGGARGGRRSRKGEGQAAPPEVRPEPETDEQRPLDPPGGEHNEHRREQRMLDGPGGLDELVVDIEDGRHARTTADAGEAGVLLVAVNSNSSGLEEPETTARQLVALLEEQGARAEAVVTEREHELWSVLRSAAAADRRVVLVGGDGTVHAAANAPLSRLPELALVPTGRANNVARALGIPTSRQGALAVATRMPARPLDVLSVATPDRLIYAVEAVSGGFQADARAGYRAGNSADLRQGLRALLRAVRRYTPYVASVEVGEATKSTLASAQTAQLFISNLPYFGFGFEVDPGADPSDGLFETILLEARSRRRLVRLLAAARRGRHLRMRGVRRVAARVADLTQPLPLVADATSLGVTTATVSVAPARLRVASDPA
jgi:membrane-associated protein